MHVSTHTHTHSDAINSQIEILQGISNHSEQLAHPLTTHHSPTLILSIRLIFILPKIQWLAKS